MIHYRALTTLHRSRVVRWGIAVGVLCALPVLGLLTVKIAPRISPAFVLVALVAPAGVLAIAWKPELGVVAAAIAAVLSRFRIPTGTSAEIVISLVICAAGIALWIVRMLVEEKRLWIRPASTNAPLIGFMVAVAFSWVWSWAFRDPLVQDAAYLPVSVGAGALMILLPACLLWISNTVRSMHWLDALVWVVLLEGLLVLIVDLGMVWVPAIMEPIHTFLNSNPILHLNSHGLLSLWCVSLALALALFDRRLHWAMRIALLAYVGGWLYWGFVLRASWLTGWVPVFMAMAVVAWLRSKKLFVVLMVAAVVGAGGYYYRTSFGAEKLESGMTRLTAYAVNWRVTSKHLLFGTGPAGYAAYYMAYFPTEAMASHSNYIDVLAQTGLVGSAFFLWFFGAQVWKGVRLRQRLKGRGDLAEALPVAVLGGTVGCVLAMALGDWLIPFAYTQSFVGFDLAMISWLFMGSIGALQYVLTSDAGSKGAHTPADRTAT